MPPQTYDFSKYRGVAERAVAGLGQGYKAVDDMHLAHRKEEMDEAESMMKMDDIYNRIGRENVEAGGDAPDLSALTNVRANVGAMLNGQAPQMSGFKKTHESVTEMKERHADSRQQAALDASKYTFGQGTDADGNPMIWSGNTKTGQAQLTGVGGTEKGGTGADRAGSQLDVAYNQAKNAHTQMEEYERRLRSDAPDKVEISPVDATLASRVFIGAPDARFAEYTLNKRNPDLLKYVRNAKAIGVAERLITPRGGSNYLTQQEQALAAVGAGGNDDQIAQAYQYRDALVRGLEKHRGGNRRVGSKEEAGPNGEASSISDADLWEQKRSEGMSAEQATAYVKSRKK